MALDRTWFNALVDDDGSNTVGTVWNKAQIDALLDSVDVELAKNASGSFTPRLGANSGDATYNLRQGHYVKQGNLVYVAGRMWLASKGSLGAGALAIADLPFNSSVYTYQAGIQVGYVTGLATAAASIGAWMNTNAAYCTLRYIPAAGGTAQVDLIAANISDSFDIMFGGCYRID